MVCDIFVGTPYTNAPFCCFRKRRKSPQGSHINDSLSTITATATAASHTTALERILHEAVVCVGYLSALHEENQANLCRCPPVLLLKLCRLPVAYFSQKDLADILFPSLIACCFQNYDNTALLVSEFNPILVANYLEV